MTMRIIPQPDTLSAPYWEGALRGQLLLQQCTRCSSRIHPPLPMCPRCRCMRLAWTPASGDGVVYSRTVVHHAAHLAVASKVPYLVALVTLDEGPRMVCNIVNTPMAQVGIGMRVRVVFESVSTTVALPQFELVMSLPR